MAGGRWGLKSSRKNQTLITGSQCFLPYQTPASCAPCSAPQLYWKCRGLNLCSMRESAYKGHSTIYCPKKGPTSEGGSPLGKDNDRQDSA